MRDYWPDARKNNRCFWGEIMAYERKPKIENIRAERDELKKERLIALAVTAPLMIYGALDKKPPKILKAMVLAVAVDMILKATKKLT